MVAEYKFTVAVDRNNQKANNIIYNTNFCEILRIDFTYAFSSLTILGS